MENKKFADSLEKRLPNVFEELGFTEIEFHPIDKENSLYNRTFAYKDIKNPFYSGKQLRVNVWRKMKVRDSSGVSDREYIKYRIKKMQCNQEDKDKILNILKKYSKDGLLFESQICIPPMLSRSAFGNSEAYPAVKSLIDICRLLKFSGFETSSAQLSFIADEGNWQEYHAMEEICEPILIYGKYGERNPICVRTEQDSELFIKTIKKEINSAISALEKKN